jgi:Cdc6-like AAA superfamily ATPase
MFVKSDIALIIGKKNTGKTTLARTLAKQLDNNYIYIDCIKTKDEQIEEIYYDKKKYNNTIIFDNYVESKNNIDLINLFIHNNNFTIIFVVQYIISNKINKADVIYFAKEKYKSIIDRYYDKIKSYYKNKNKFVDNMNKLKDYGFICIDKDKRDKKEELFMKI